MPAKLVHNSYGKSAVKVTRIIRGKTRDTLIEMDVAIQLEGKFTASYTKGDNASIIATDTMKNTVYALAAGPSIISPEHFALELGWHFTDSFPHVSQATIEIAQANWNRLTTNRKPHPHAHIEGGASKRTAKIIVTQKHDTLIAGVRDVMILKTTDSAFKGFLRDQFTTLKDTDDRIFATRLSAQWSYSDLPDDFCKTHKLVLDKMLEVFANHKSLAVQQTMYAMGQAALDVCPLIAEIELEMPNQHRIPVNMEPLGLPNRNEVFITTSEPYGLIKATMKR